MFGEQSTNVGVESSGERGSHMRASREVSEEVREIDRALRRLARRQATLDVELLAWLRRAEEENVWPKLGYVHALEYLEEVFAFAPRTAIERLRVANELGELPQIEKALASGELAFGAVRELSRVATAETEAAWLAEARGKRLRDIERMVAGRKKGDGPDAKPDPNRIRHGVWLELDGESLAAWRQMRAMLDDELGEKLDDRTAVIELARRCLAGEAFDRDARHCDVGDGSHAAEAFYDDACHSDGGSSSHAGTDEVFDDDACRSDGGYHAGANAVFDETCHRGGDDASHGQRRRGSVGAELATLLSKASDVIAGSEKPGTEGVRKAGGKARSARPLHMQHSMKCPDCGRAWQLGAGAAIELSASALARIECDAVIVDDENGERTAWTIPPAARRKVFMRDHGCCQVPGCRAARFLEVHHIIHRAHGGSNDEWNLIVLCSGHHKLHHDGVLEISGRAPGQLRFVRLGIELLPAGKMPEHIRLLGDTRVEREVVEADLPGERVRRAANPNADDARLVLTTLGYTSAVARRAVDLACADEGTETLERLIKAALRNCP